MVSLYHCVAEISVLQLIKCVSGRLTEQLKFNIDWDSDWLIGLTTFNEMFPILESDHIKAKSLVQNTSQRKKYPHLFPFCAKNRYTYVRNENQNKNTDLFDSKIQCNFTADYWKRKFDSSITKCFRVTCHISYKQTSAIVCVICSVFTCIFIRVWCCFQTIDTCILRTYISSNENPSKGRCMSILNEMTIGINLFRNTIPQNHFIFQLNFILWNVFFLQLAY